MKAVIGLGILTLAGVAALSAASAAPAGDAAAGQKIFARCAACHNVDASKPSGIGPNLHGVYGRKAASLAGYKYSAALTASKITWNDAQLARFLAGPMKAVPGTKMYFPGLSNPADQANVIAYLKQNSGKK